MQHSWLDVCPFVLETTGPAGAFATSLVKKLAKRKALRDEMNIEVAKLSIWSSLSTMLARSVAKQLSLAFSSTPDSVVGGLTD